MKSFSLVILFMIIAIFTVIGIQSCFKLISEKSTISNIAGVLIIAAIVSADFLIIYKLIRKK